MTDPQRVVWPETGRSRVHGEFRMSTTPRTLALAVAIAVGFVSSAVAKKRPPCADAAYVVEEAPIIPGDRSVHHNGIVVRGGEIAVGGSCAAVRVRQKPSKRGTHLDARWPQCTDVKGPVRFRGVVDPACTTLTGTVVGRKAKLHRAVSAKAAPSGEVHGVVRIVRVVPVPEAARADVLADKMRIEADGATVAPDGSTIGHVPVGAAGWRVTLGEREARTGADGSFTLTVDPATETEGVLYHPAQDQDPAVAFWVVPHLAPAGGTPTPIDVEVDFEGPCGMNDNPVDDPAYCAMLGPSALLRGAVPALDPSPEVKFVWNVGPLGSYPSLTSSGCRDQDGGFGLSGTSITGVFTNYFFSTCDTQVTLGCCDNELGSLKVLVKTAVGRLTGFKPVSCEQNHKGRFCDDVLHDDVGVGVPAGTANASAVLGFQKSVTQEVQPSVAVPVTAHNNACYGETIVTKTVDQLHGTLGPLTGNKVLHYTGGPKTFTYVADVALTYTPPACPPNNAPLDATDVYDFAGEGHSVDVTFHLACTHTTTTTTSTSTTAPPTTSTSSTTTTTTSGSTTTTGPTCANGGIACGDACGGACPGVCVWGGGSTCILQHCGSPEHVCAKGPTLILNNCTSDAECPAGEICGAQGLACGTTSGCSATCPE
jgi:hypothetical protein